jgi:1,4-alpha-glucan branching enzyme
MTGTVFSDLDQHLFCEGTLYRSYDLLGAHPTVQEGRPGTRFAVWAPDATAVSVFGDFNGWKIGANPLSPQGGTGVWAGFVPGVAPGAMYKYALTSRHGGTQLEKADPHAFAAALRPRRASKVWDLSAHVWKDSTWVQGRPQVQSLSAPLSIYEVHLGSWRRIPEEGDRWLTYRELAPRLVEHVRHMGFTHVELLPIAEHPFDGSWGYQVSGYFAPTSRFGTPDDFMEFVDHLHQNGIGVFLDWVPAHFPRDPHALGLFDGSHLYEHADPRLGEQKDWGTFIFNYGRHEVANFLIANALFWIDKYHIDGLRVDAVASMLYLDYSRKNGEWIPNRFGGRENLEAVHFLRRLNEQVQASHPGALVMAEESTAWPMVTRPAHLGGLGFDLKWDMGWMNDTLSYFAEDPVHRKYHHHRLTFRQLYAFSESFILPLSHDEVVHGKGSLLAKMPGDRWQKLANLRLLLGYQFLQPGKKLLFMGQEFAQEREWRPDQSLDWHLVEEASHAGVQRWVRDLNTFYRGCPAAHDRDTDARGFEWIDCGDAEQSVLLFLRRGEHPDDLLVAAFNFTPLPRHNYRVGVPRGGRWTESLNSDAPLYGGSGQGNMGGLNATPVRAHGRSHSLNITLPPLGVVVFQCAPCPP